MVIATIEFVIILGLFFFIFQQNAQHSKVLANMETGIKSLALKIETALKKL